MKKETLGWQILVFVLGLIAILVFSKATPRNNTSSSESLFAKQARCADSAAAAKIQLKESYRLFAPYFYDIFYSPKTGTCVYTYGVILYGEPPDEIGAFIISDYFTKEEIMRFDYDNSSGDESKFSYTIRMKFMEAVDAYKK